MYQDSDVYKIHDHITHSILDKPAMRDGSPVPHPEHFFRKAKEMYTHDECPDGNITCGNAARIKMSMEKPSFTAEISTNTKARVS